MTPIKEAPSVERLEPRARIWSHNLGILYAISIFSQLSHQEQADSDKAKALSKGANRNNGKETLIWSIYADLLNSTKCNRQAYKAFGFDWTKETKPPVKTIKRLVVGVMRVVAFACVLADRSGERCVSVAEDVICRIAGIGLGKNKITDLQALLALLNALSPMDYYKRHTRPVQVEMQSKLWRISLADQSASEYAGNDMFTPPINGASSLWVRSFAGDQLGELSEDQKIKLGVIKKLNKEQKKLGIKRLLDWQHYAISAPRLLHSADLRLSAEEEALYGWLERNLTLAGPKTEAYRLFSLEGIEGQWLGALSNHRGQGTERSFRGNRLESIVKNSFFPINKETWRPRHWYQVLRQLMSKLGGVLLIKLEGSESLQDAKDWDNPPYLEKLPLFPYLPLEWYQKVKVNYAAFEQGHNTGELVEYRGVVLDARDALKQKRLAEGLTQKQLADHLGVAAVTLKKWESKDNGITKPHVLEWIRRVC